MIDFKVENGTITGHFEGTTEELFTEYALLTYNFWAKLFDKKEVPLDRFLDVLQQAVPQMPEAFEIHTRHFEENSNFVIEKTGVEQ